MRRQVPDRRFVEMYEAYYQTIHRYFIRRGLDSEGEAADLAAEVFLTAWRRLAIVPPPPHDRAWLYGVARRLFLRHRRTAWRRHRLSLRLATVVTVADQVAQGAGGDRIDEVRAAIARLSGRDQEVLELVMWDGLSHAEAARVVGRTPNAIAVQMHRIRKNLGEVLGDPEPGPPEEQLGAQSEGATAPCDQTGASDQPMKKGPCL